MLDFDTEYVEVKFKGEVFKINKPSNEQIASYSATLKGAESDADKTEALVSFFVALGLSREIYNQLNMGQVKKLLSSLHDAEKN